MVRIAVAVIRAHGRRFDLVRYATPHRARTLRSLSRGPERVGAMTLAGNAATVMMLMHWRVASYISKCN